MTAKTLEEVLREQTKTLLALPGVVGTAEGLCHDSPCIRVFVVAKTAELERKLPQVLDGYPVIMETTGEIGSRPG